MKTNNFTLVNCDTDSIAFSKSDGSPFTEAEQEDLLKDLNSHFPEKISWEHDGIYEKFVILKAKNYIMVQNGKLKKKGSSLKSSKIEPRIKDFMGEIIDCLVSDSKDSIIDVYHKYCREVHYLTDITPWCSKKTITDKVLNPERSNEQKVLDSLKGAPVQMGDKIYVYYGEVITQAEVAVTRKGVSTGKTRIKETIENPLILREDWDDAAPNHSVDILLKKLYNTLVIFQNVIDINQFPKYHLKGKKVKEQLKQIL